MKSTPIIYERVDNIVYARYANASGIARWVIQDTQEQVNGLSTGELKEIIELSEKNTTLKAALDKLLTVYYIIKQENADE